MTFAAPSHRRLTGLFVAAILLVSALGAADARAGVHQQTTYVEAGGYRTLATLWNTSAKAEFLCPAGAKIRVRYGGGWFAFHRQNQTLDCMNAKRLSVGKFSAIVARMQIKVPESGNVNWAYITEGPS
jgi:hypothetical protein